MSGETPFRSFSPGMTAAALAYHQSPDRAAIVSSIFNNLLLTRYVLALVNDPATGLVRWWFIHGVLPDGHGSFNYFYWRQDGPDHLSIGQAALQAVLVGTWIVGLVNGQSPGYV